MENKINNNGTSTSFRPFFLFKQSQKNIDKKPKPVKNIFLTKTFASKLFIKLCRDVIDPIIICLQTLKYEPENRKQDEIEATIPYLKTLEYLKDFIYFQEDEISSFNLMAKFAKITFYQYHGKNSIIKRPGEYNETFYILLNGEMSNYNLRFEIENLTLEQYLLYLVELEIINENEIINKCYILNKNIIEIGEGEFFSVEKLVKSINKFNYRELQIKAEKELIKLGFHRKLYKEGNLRFVPDIPNYLKIFDKMGKTDNDDGTNKFPFYIGKYQLCAKLIKGQIFNNITTLRLKEDLLYLCETNCDLGQIRREEYVKEGLNNSVKEKMVKLFSKIKNKYFIFKDIKDETFLDNYANLFLYKKFKKGDKIFIQGGLFNGIYLILDGNVSLYTNISIDKLCNLLVNVINSVKNFSEYIPSFNSEHLVSNFNIVYQKLYKSNKLSHMDYLVKNKIDISSHKNFEIIGFYELFNYKNDLLNFTAECVSEEANLVFLPKNNFNLILGKERTFYTGLIPLVENKIQFIVGKFKIFVEHIIRNIQSETKKINALKINMNYNLKNYNINNEKILLNKNRNNNNKFPRYNTNNINNNYNNNKIFDFSNTDKLNEIEKKNDIINNYNTKNNSKFHNTINSYNYYESINNFKKELNTKRKDSEESMLHRKNQYRYTYYKNFFMPQKMKSIDNKVLNSNMFNAYKTSLIPKVNKTKLFNGINFKDNNRFSLTTISNNQIKKLPYYKNINKNYQKFPMINSQPKNFIYK